MPSAAAAALAYQGRARRTPACRVYFVRKAEGHERSEEDRAISEVADRLTKTFPEAPPDEVTRAVQEARPEFDGRPIRDFVPLFVERSAKHRLLHRTH